ncbi:MAG: 50S ribosomal protein L30, partial [bacterium]|nr:50S ribosomal protein L30 [bacterium]
LDDRGLGLRRLHHTVVVEDTPSIRGMVKKVMHLLEVTEHLRASLVQMLQGSTGKLELSARLERNVGATHWIGKADDVVAFHHRVPAELVAHAVQHGLDAASAFIRQRRQIVGMEAKFLVLGADTPVFRRLAAGFEKADEFGETLHGPARFWGVGGRYAQGL